MYLAKERHHQKHRKADNVRIRLGPLLSHSERACSAVTTRNVFDELAFLNKPRLSKLPAEKVESAADDSSSGSERTLSSPPSPRKKRFKITNAVAPKKSKVSPIPPSTVSGKPQLESGHESIIWDIEEGLDLPAGSESLTAEQPSTTLETSHITLDYNNQPLRPWWADLDLPFSVEANMSGLLDAGCRREETTQLLPSFPKKPVSVLSYSSLAPWQSASQCGRNLDLDRTSNHLKSPYHHSPTLAMVPIPRELGDLEEGELRLDRSGEASEELYTAPVDQLPSKPFVRSGEEYSPLQGWRERASSPPSSVVSCNTLQLALRNYEAEDKSAIHSNVVDGLAHNFAELIELATRMTEDPTTACDEFLHRTYENTSRSQDTRYGANVIQLNATDLAEYPLQVNQDNNVPLTLEEALDAGYTRPVLLYCPTWDNLSDHYPSSELDDEDTPFLMILDETVTNLVLSPEQKTMEVGDDSCSVISSDGQHSISAWEGSQDVMAVYPFEILEGLGLDSDVMSSSSHPSPASSSLSTVRWPREMSLCAPTRATSPSAQLPMGHDFDRADLSYAEADVATNIRNHWFPQRL